MSIYATDAGLQRCSATVIRDFVSHFSAELAGLIERKYGGSQLNFGRSVGIDQSIVSRQCAGVSLPDRSTVRRLALSLSETQAIPLVVAYLHDLCPAPLKPKLAIRAISNAGLSCSAESLQVDLARFSARQRNLIRELLDLLATDPKASAFLSAVLAFIRRPEGSSGVRLPEPVRPSRRSV